MIPQTVPKSPTKGVTAPVVASQVSHCSMRVSSLDEAICKALCTASRLRMRGLPGFSLTTAWLSISRYQAWKISASGLNFRLRLNVRISESRLLCRNTFKNSWDSRRAALKFLYL